jgi:putative membrane protein
VTGPAAEPQGHGRAAEPHEHGRAAEPQGTGPAAEPPGLAAEPRRRLHPLSPLLRGARLAVVVVAAISWRGYQDLGIQRWLMAVGAVAILVLLWSGLSWYVTGYHVVGRELRVYEGLLSRRTRAIPLERLQSVELVRPLLARVFGLAELRLEVVGAAKTEAPLAFLAVDEATALRERLLTIARGGRASPAPDPSGQPAAAVARTPQAEQRIHLIANRDLVISQLPVTTSVSSPWPAR